MKNIIIILICLFLSSCEQKNCKKECVKYTIEVSYINNYKDTMCTIDASPWIEDTHPNLVTFGNIIATNVRSFKILKTEKY